MAGITQGISNVSTDNGSQSAVGIFNGPVHVGSRDDEALKLLPNAKNAPFNSYDRQHEPACLHNTRVNVLQDIYDWADGKDGQDERCIFWLNGLAGTGKSTISRTVAHEFNKQKSLGASFFFSKGGGDASHAGKLVTSLARQLADNVPSARQYISEASKRSDIATLALSEQWHQLILGPLSKLESESPLLCILVIDALDECEDDRDIQTILQLLAEARSLTTVRLRVFLTSRPEVPIRHSIHLIPQATHQDFVLHDIPPAIVSHDITLFLQVNFEQIRNELQLKAEWPGSDIIEKLALAADSLFIWAATACWFVREGRKFAADRLSLILKENLVYTSAADSSNNDSSTDGSDNKDLAITPDKRLNGIYNTVLEYSACKYPKDERKRLYKEMRRTLGGIVLLFSPLSAKSLANLLNFQESSVFQTLDDLHSILDIQRNPTRLLRLHHPSFRDFLLTKDRCSKHFYVDERRSHQLLAADCIQLMSQTLKKDICGMHAPSSQVNQVKSSRLQQCLPPEVQYACLYWVQHLQKSSSQAYDNEIYKFLQTHLLHWLEALGWIGRTSEGIQAILSLEALVLANENSNLRSFINDAKRFALYSQSVIEKAPLQLYCSALIFAPENSIVKRQFKKDILPWIQMKSKVRADWSATLLTLEGHSGSINSVAFSPDGKMVASGSDDHTVRLWDASIGTLLRTLEGHSYGVNSVAFSPDGKVVASGSDDATVRLWDASTGTLLQMLEGHSSYVKSVAFSPDSKMVASGSDDATVRLWDASTGTLLQMLEGHSSYVKSVAFSPDSKMVASGSDDATVRLWDASTGTLLRTLEGHSYSVNSVAFSPDGKVVASGSDDATVWLWDASIGTLLRTLEGHSYSVNSVAFSPDGKVVASGSNDHTVRLWDASTGTLLQMLEGHSDSVWSVAFSPDGKMVASGSLDHTVRLWDASTGTPLRTLEGHSDSVWSVAFSPDGKMVASGSLDHTVRLWDASTGTPLQILEGHSCGVNSVAFSPDSKMVASGSDGHTVRLWDASTGTLLQMLKGHSDSVWSVAFSPDSKMAASGSDDATVRLWDASTGTLLRTLEGHSDTVWSVAFSPDGKVAASGSYDHTMRLWDASTGTLLRTLEGHSDSVWSVAFSPDGKMVASGSLDHTVRLWDASTGTLLQTLEGHFSTVKSVAFSLHSLTVLDNWVTKDKKTILWLPPDYRLTSVAVWNKTIIIGHSSGGISILQLE